MSFTNNARNDAHNVAQAQVTPSSRSMIPSSSHRAGDSSAVNREGMSKATFVCGGWGRRGGGWGAKRGSGEARQLWCETVRRTYRVSTDQHLQLLSSLRSPQLLPQHLIQFFPRVFHINSVNTDPNVSCWRLSVRILLTITIFL